MLVLGWTLVVMVVMVVMRLYVWHLAHLLVAKGESARR